LSAEIKKQINTALKTRPKLVQKITTSHLGYAPQGLHPKKSDKKSFTIFILIKANYCHPQTNR